MSWTDKMSWSDTASSSRSSGGASPRDSIHKHELCVIIALGHMSKSWVARATAVTKRAAARATPLQSGCDWRTPSAPRLVR
eukprot:3570892-Prymnesium_polylepis.1